MKRCFIAINFDEEIKNKIVEIQKQLPEFLGKKTEIENLHLTLKFLGEIDDDKIKIVQEKLREIKFKKFFITLDKLGFFSEKILRIVWLGVDENDKEIFALQKIIDDKLTGLFEKEKRFMSHLTIARVKRVEDKKRFFEEFEKIKLSEFKFEVKEFYLIESELKLEAPVYTTINSFKLI